MGSKLVCLRIRMLSCNWKYYFKCHEIISCTDRCRGYRLCFDFEASKHVEVADMCDSQEAANQNGLCCLETLQEWQNKNLSLSASSYDGTSRKTLYGANMYLYSWWPLAYFQDDQTTFLKMIIFLSVSAACYFPVEVQGEFMTQSLAHQEISYTRYIFDCQSLN